MSKLSYTLYKNADGTWRAEIPFPGRKNGVSIHQTGEKDRARAERSAKRRCHRLPIEDRAHKRHAEKRRKGLPIERSGLGKPGRPRKVPLPPEPPAIDATVTAAKLRALPVDSGAGPVEPERPEPPLPTPGPAPENPPEPAADPIPELPEAPAAPVNPDGIGDDRAADPDAEGNEFFADVMATAVVAGTVKVCHSYAEKRGKKANEPSPKALEWYTEGLQFRFRQLMGNAALTPNMKLMIGAGGVILSMLWGAADLDGVSRERPAAPATSDEAPAPSDDTTARQAEAEHEQWEEPAPRAITNGHGDAAAGKFR